MASYLVLEPPGAAPDVAEKAVIVRDGFSVLAFVVPLIWFLWHRMWLEALAFLAIAFVLGALGMLPGFEVLAPLISILFAVLIGLEANALRAASLRRTGWREWGVVEGANRGEAELRYAAEAEEPAAERPPVVPPDLPTAPRAQGPAFGLIDYPRKS